MAETFVFVNLTIVNVIWNGTTMAPLGQYWTNMEQNLDSSFLDTLGLDHQTLTQTKLLGLY